MNHVWNGRGCRLRFKECTVAYVCWWPGAWPLWKSLQRSFIPPAPQEPTFAQTFGLKPSASVFAWYFSFIGLTSLAILNTDSLSASTNVHAAWHHNTCLSSAHRSQRCLDVIFVLLPRTAAYSKVSADKLWLTFVLLCCPVYMELSARRTERHWPVISFVSEAAQDISVQSILAHQARTI